MLLLVLLLAKAALAQDWFMSDNRIQMDYCLEKAPRAKVLDFLEGQYRGVLFTPHRTGNGFHALGSREDLLQIKRQLADLDRTPGPPPPPIREYLPVRYGDIHEVRALLQEIMPDAHFEVDRRLNLLVVEGTPGAVDQVRELLSDGTRPPDQVIVDLKVLELTRRARRNLRIQPHHAAVTTTIVVSENGRPIHSYSQPSQMKFRTIPMGLSRP